MSHEVPSVTVTVDNRVLKALAGATILDVARQNDVYIPTLCYHKDLSPHGGCRMCIVEVEGLRNFPTACTTPVTDGMVIRTQTSQLQAMRMDILQLFLSEHTSSCLVCDEAKECKEFMGTIRKAGVTTGCRYCPKDAQCELQAVSESLGVKEISYPISYRGLRVETEDPFYDRDYNLCILCGRCVRVCQEIRVANVLAYKNRGRNTVIGPAFHRTHLEAGCEFCGACVAVCPTGSLREKAREWEGKPDREEVSTCSFCGVGCQLRLLVKGDRVIGSLPFNDPLVNDGQLCVKGRFCNTELVNGYRRLRNPSERYGQSSTEISWERAIEMAAEKISGCATDEFAMLISPNCTTEDLYVAQKFVRTVTHSHNIDTSARIFYGSGFNAYLKLLKRSVPLQAVRESPLILTLGLDTRYGRSVVGVALRQAIKRGAKVVSIHPRRHNFSLIAHQWLEPSPGQEAMLLGDTLELLKGGSAARLHPESERFRDQLLSAVELLKNHTGSVILVGSEFLPYENSGEILRAIDELAQACGAGIMPLPAQNNLLGSLLAGAGPEFLPGGVGFSDAKQRLLLEQLWGQKLPEAPPGWNAWSVVRGVKTKVLYLVGELPPTDRHNADFLIYQNIYPPYPYCHPDLILPVAAWTEVDGTFVNGEGRVQPVRKAVEPLGNALPDWEILCRIARRMGAGGFDFRASSAIREELAAATHEYASLRTAQPLTSLADAVFTGEGVPHAAQNGVQPFLLTVSAVEHSHRGFPLSAWVEGSQMLLTEGMLEINPEDAREYGISQGENVIVAIDGMERIWPAKLMRDQPRGTVHASLRDSAFIRPNPQHVTIRRAHV